MLVIYAHNVPALQSPAGHDKWATPDVSRNAKPTSPQPKRLCVGGGKILIYNVL